MRKIDFIMLIFGLFCAESRAKFVNKNGTGEKKKNKTKAMEAEHKNKDINDDFEFSMQDNQIEVKTKFPLFFKAVKKFSFSTTKHSDDTASTSKRSERSDLLD
uniref:Uncharacterized protein n=1 Tax=Globodera rostochiensis TaxID=31243 RepID=A0A914HLD9_GLORO